VLKYKFLKAVTGHFFACQKYQVISQQTSEAVAQFLNVVQFPTTFIFTCVLVCKKLEQCSDKSKARHGEHPVAKPGAFSIFSLKLT